MTLVYCHVDIVASLSMLLVEEVSAMVLVSFVAVVVTLVVDNTGGAGGWLCGCGHRHC